MATNSGTIVTPTFTAMYSTWVYSDPGNTQCAGCLDFVYQFTDSAPGTSGQWDPLRTFTMGSFLNFATDVGTNPFGVHDPITVSRNTPGDVVGFNYNTFADQVNPTETTPFLVIDTNARHFVPGFLSAQDQTAGTGFGFQPSAIPEPASLMLMGSGLLLAGGVIRRKLRPGK